MTTLSAKKAPLAISLLLLGSAMLILAGCSWKSEPTAMSEKKEELPLDKLKRAETDQQLTEEAAKKGQKEAANKVTSTTPMTGKQYPTAPAMTISPAKKYGATLHTDKGDIEVELDSKEMPQTVNSFVFLAREKFYEGIIFHRTMPGFMIQGGDPTGTGMGGPGYNITEKPKANTTYKRGTLAMAKTGMDPAGTSGSQFFIMHADYALPSDYATFGQVIKGLEVVDAIATAPTKPGGEGSTPVTPVKILSVDIAEN